MANREPVIIEGYMLGDPSKHDDFEGEMSREDAGKAAALLQVNDSAFIKRSDMKWTYALLTERTESPGVILRFDVDAVGNTKSFPEHQWGKYIRVIKPKSTTNSTNATEPAKPTESSVSPAPQTTSPEKTDTVQPATTSKPAISVPADDVPEPAPVALEIEAKDATPTIESKKDTPKASNTKKQELVSSSGFFAKFFGGSSKTAPAPVLEAKPATVETANPPATDTTEVKPDVTATAEPTTDAQKPVSKGGEDFKRTTSLTSSAGVEVPVNDFLTPKLESPKTSKALKKPEEPTKQMSPVIEETKVAPPALSPVVPIENAPIPTPVHTDANDDVSVGSTKSKKGKFKAFKNLVSSKNSKAALESPKESPNEQKPAVDQRRVASPPASPDKQVEFSKTDKEVEITGTATIEWDDLKTVECDYDENPSYLFQALEAREHQYAYDMFKGDSKLAEQECRTWIVARDNKTSEAKFRALPLHAALVFGAPDQLVEKIFKANPTAVRGRDLKGCLPVHYAFKNNASDHVIRTLITAFPKGYFVTDKSGKSCVDHVDPKGSGAERIDIINTIVFFGLEDAKGKWVAESEIEWGNKEEELRSVLLQEKQAVEESGKEALVTLEEEHKRRVQIMEEQHRKELLKMKVKHADETQALLDGFKVKMDFERKLRNLKNDNKK